MLQVAPLVHRSHQRSLEVKILRKARKRAMHVEKPLPTIKLDYMRERDLRQIVDIERQSFSDPWHMSAFRQAIKLNDPNAYFLVARQDQALAAYINYWLVIDDAHIANLAVSPTHRRRGIGKYLLGKSLKHIQDQGGNQVFLEVRVSNIPAQNLYQQMGFQIVHIRKRYYQNNGEDAYILRLENLSDISLQIDNS